MESNSVTQVITVKLRVSPDLKDKIANSAKNLNRSMNADMVARLEGSFESSENTSIERLSGEIAELRQLLLSNSPPHKGG